MADPVDPTYGTLNYEKQGGGEWDVGGVLDIKDGGQFQIGAAQVAATAAEINELHDATAAADGTGVARWARATYDFAVSGGAVGTIALDATVPAKAIIVDGMIDVLTAPTSGGAATIAVQAEAAGDVLAAAGYAGLTAGLHDVVPVGTAATAIKTTVARTVSLVIGAAPLTAGKLIVHLRYVLSS